MAIEDTKIFGIPYFQNNLFNEKEEVKEIEYSKRKIPFGIEKGRGIFGIEIGEATRIAIVAGSGRGKSYITRGLIDRLHLVGHSMIYINDIKGELVSSLKPVQSKFRKFLLKGEMPRGTPVAELRPTFFRQYSKILPYKNFWYSVDMANMTEREFATLVKADKMKGNQPIIVNEIYKSIQKMYKDNPDAEFSVDMIYDIIDNIPELDERSAPSIKLKFKPLENVPFYVEKYKRSISKIIQKGYIPAINLQDFESFGSSSVDFPTTTLSIVLREVIRARREKEISDLWIIVDEATRFAGNSKNNSFKEELMDALQVERAFGTSFITIWQDIDDMPEKIYKQSRYIMVSGGENATTIRAILNFTGIASSPQKAPKMATTLKSKMRGRPYAWIVFDTKNFSYHIIDPLAPLSWHKEGGE